MCLLVLGASEVHAQCFGTSQFPPNTITPVPQVNPTSIAGGMFAGEYAVLSLTAGRTYRFTSSIATDHLTISSAPAAGMIQSGTQPLIFTVPTTQLYYLHVHTNSSCGTQQQGRTLLMFAVHCEAGATQCGGGDEAITQVAIGNLVNTGTGCGPFGYSDFTNLTGTVFIGQSMPISVTNLNPFPGDQAAAYVDWNRDFDFNDAGESFILSTTDNILFTGNLLVPAGIEPGITVRLRVRLTFTGTLSPCGTASFGETEDYSLFTTPLIPPSGIYTGGNGRGDIAASFTPPPTGLSRFNGGNGRGDVASGFVPTPVGLARFNGGDGRGDVAGAFVPTPVGLARFNGGDGRGDVAGTFVPTPVGLARFNGGSGRGDVATSTTFTAGISLLAKVSLSGPYNATTGLMGDALRALPGFPLTEPYAGLGYAHVGGGGESTQPSVLAVTGSNAIVDWVVVELRSSSNPATVVASRSGLLQRDGDVVAADGVSALSFQAAAGNYHVAVRHRNHLGAMTASPIAFSTGPASLDLRASGTATFGSFARNSIAGTFPTQALWSGDVNFDGVIKYVGENNDRDPILVRIGGTVPTAQASGYHVEDVNMDGVVKYVGEGNDRDPILVNIGGSVPTNTRLEQLP